ncbi:MAG: DNA-binding protein [Moraxellaceae bacterium]|nr:MAG: DNA-binding protein [Moraxellaceae bacterium]
MKKVSEITPEEKAKLKKEFNEASPDDGLSHYHLAAFLDCSPWTLQRQRTNGSPIPFTKIGRCIAYIKSDVLAYRERIKCTNTSQYQRTA